MAPPPPRASRAGLGERVELGEELQLQLDVLRRGLRKVVQGWPTLRDLAQHFG